MEICGDKKKILMDLGRPTKRGIKKCFKCGMYNGTRGFTCKNKQCDAVLRDVEKRKVNLDAVKLTGTPKQVYSVRVRDKGPDNRGFVQLPMIYSNKHDGQERLNLQNEEFTTITEVSICFVDSCQRLFDDSILKCHENEPEQNCSSSVCMHIESALRSTHVATPLLFKGEVLNFLSISEDMKQRLWTFGKETDGVVVQRVSKSVMAVKCQVTPKFPLGYLHLAFFMSKGKDNFDKFVCGCSEHKVQTHGREEPSCCDNKCIHYFACIASFASDSKYIEEFKTFINADCRLGLATLEADDKNTVENNFLTAANPATTSKSISSGDESVLEKSSIFDFDPDGFFHLKLANCTNLSIDSKLLNQYTNALVSLGRTNFNNDKTTKSQNKMKKGKRGYQEEDVISFTEWLSSITECINETINYSSSENPDPLVFHIPLRFFELLRERLSSSSSKMRLPNSTEKYVPKNKPFFGNLYKYTWHITSILHVKQMFDTPDVSVELIRHFLRNKEGEFIECSHLDLEHNLLKSVRAPFHITFMKVGIVSKGQKDPIPFIIEWIPNFLRVSNFGELKLIFQIGHQNKFG